MKRLGVIGGLGPMASAYFMKLLTEFSDARTDQEHMEVILYSRPSIPDRTAFILGYSKENPLPKLVETGLNLKHMGAQMLAIPCVTAHYFYDDIAGQTGLPVLHALKETGRYLKERGVECAGILATDGTIKSGLFEKILSQYGIRTLTPDVSAQCEVMSLIYDEIKAGLKPDVSHLENASRGLRARGAQVCILGCTELSLLKGDGFIGDDGYVDVLEVLAGAAVRECEQNE